MSAKEVSPLKKIADLIRAGKIDKARPQLVELLRAEPENAQAWFLLSYALDDPQRKQYALMQALKADPNFERAEARLRQLRGQPPLPPRSKPAQPVYRSEPPAPAPVAPAPPPQPAPVSSLEDSLRAEQEPAAKKPSGLRRGLVAILLIAGFAALFWLSRDFFAGLLAGGSSTPEPTDRPAFSTFPPVFTATPQGAAPSATPTQAPIQIGSLNALDAESLAQIETIRQQASLVRGLDLPDPVEPILLPVAQAEAVLSSLTRQNTEAARQERILRAYGLLGPLQHLRDYELNLHAEPYGSVFVADPDRIYLLGSEFSDVLSYAYARSYGLALTSGNHAEEVAGAQDCSVFSDGCRAQSAFVRGDANLAGEQWLNSYAGAAIFQAVNQAEPNYAWVQGEEPSAFALQDLAFYSESGLEFARGLFEAGGWEQVDAAYAELPTTSEQILHPEKYLAGEDAVAIDPFDLSDALGSQWQPQGSGELGEWLTRLVLTASQDPSARIAASRGATAAAGWGGDAFQAFWRPSDGQVVLAQLWVMDSEDEAGQLIEALQDYLTLRMGGGSSQVGVGDCWRSLGQQACVYWNGAQVLWLLLPDQQPLLDAVLGEFPEFQ